MIKTDHVKPFGLGSGLGGLFGLLLALVAPMTGSATLTPVELRCEYAVEPLGVDVEQPWLSWKLRSAALNQRQTAYQIQVRSRAAFATNGVPDLWDSGRVESDETHLIRYAGKDLTSSQQVFWSVRVWDGEGQGSDWTPFSTWTMGVLKPEEWRAKWICAPATSESVLIRKEFAVKPGLRRALMHVTGLGQFEMSLNGAKVGQDLLAPGWTDYNDTILYSTYELTAKVRTGPNAVGLTLGNGMYHVERRNRFAKFTGSFGPLRAIAQLELEYDDGAREFVVTDESWRVHPGAITYNSIYGGEDFDARLYPQGWNQSGFDDSKWQPAVVVVRPSGMLRGHSASSEPIRAIDFNLPFSEERLSNSVIVYDFAQNTSYMPRLQVNGPAGSTVRLIPAEVLNPDGSVLRSTMGSTNRGISWWQYTKATDAVESWFPQFYYVGCRYLQAELLPARPGGELPRIEMLDGVIVHSSAAPVGDFECSNPMLNRIRDLVRWAQRANMVSVLTDCPHREKLGWIEQYHLNGPAIRYEFDLARMFAKGMNDMAEAQTEEGLVPNIAPEYTQFKGAFRGAAEWGAAFLLVPWQQYEFCGDVELIRRHFPAMKRYFAYLESRATNDILSDGLGDWFDIGPKKSGASQNTPPPITASAFYYHDAKVLAQMAEVLGKTDDAQKFAATAERLRRSYVARFYQVTNGTFATGSQCANALALVLGIAEPKHRGAVLAALVRDIESRSYATTAGDVGFRFVLRALADAGRSDVVYRMITQEDHPGYGFMLKQGATSLTESWDANLTTSHNHFMLGQATEWFYHDLAGIQSDPTGPGFKRIIINPQPVGDLTWVKASYDSVRGKITSHWRRENGKFTLRVIIPPNTMATVFVPGQAEAVLNRATRLREEAGRTVFCVGSGEYAFASDW